MKKKNITFEVKNSLLIKMIKYFNVNFASGF